MVVFDVFDVVGGGVVVVVVAGVVFDVFDVDDVVVVAGVDGPFTEILLSCQPR